MINGFTLLELAYKSVPILEDMTHRIVVSSDDNEILELAEKLGALPLKRSALASGDTSTANSVIQDLLTQDDLYGNLNGETIIVYLQPTSPLRTSSHVREALDSHLAEGQPVVSVTTISEYPQKMLEVNEDNRLTSFMKESNPTANRQELPKLLIPNGAIYIFKLFEFQQKSLFPIEGAIPYLMSKESSIDIDSPIDLKIAKAVIN